MRQFIADIYIEDRQPINCPIVFITEEEAMTWIDSQNLAVFENYVYVITEVVDNTKIVRTVGN